jgi:sulfonate transport system substrate-binding protein
MTIKIGVHPSNLTLFVLSRKPELLEDLVKPTGETVEWVNYLDGTKTVTKLITGEIDFGGTGSTPPIKAQADGIPVVYVATSQPRPAHGALLVLKDSPIQTLSDLKGKKVALSQGSYQEQFLAIALHNVGLEYRDITPIQFSAPEVLLDFLNSDIDVWIAGDPLLAEAQEKYELRALSYTEGIISDRSVFFTRRAFAEKQLVSLRLIVRGLERSDRWIATHFREAAELLAAEVNNGIDAQHWEISLRRRPWGLIPVSEEFIAEQQHAADVFYRFGNIAAPITVADAVLPNRLSVFESDLVASGS